jgi:hypothetical protein
MRAHLELTPAEQRLLQKLTHEERDAVIEQMLATVREELEWMLVVDKARSAAAGAPAIVAAAERTPPPPPDARFRWPSTPMRAARR